MNEEKEKNEDLLLNLGKSLLALSFISFIIITALYLNNRPKFAITRQFSIETYGYLIASITGLLLTSSGIIFLWKTIEQTKKEMNDTRILMTEQLAESTFFNLLKMHKEIVLGEHNQLYQFQQESRALKDKLHHYFSGVYNYEFSSFSATHYFPFKIYHDVDVFRSVGRSIIHIANIIEKSMPNKDLYRDTFYLGLSDDEKFLFGMIIRNKLDSKVMDYEYNYSNYFDLKTPYHSRERNGYFPSVSLSQKFCSRPVILKSIDFDEHVEAILLRETGFNVVSSDRNIELVGVRYNGVGVFTDADQKPFLKEIEIIGRTTHLDLVDFYRDTLLPNLRENRIVYFKFYFDFKFEETIYTIKSYTVIADLKVRTSLKDTFFTINYSVSGDDLDKVLQKGKK